MIPESHILQAFVVIALLTVVLVLTNIHTVVLQFIRDKDRAKLLVYVGAILLLGALIINTTYHVFGQVMEASASAKSAGMISE